MTPAPYSTTIVGVSEREPLRRNNNNTKRISSSARLGTIESERGLADYTIDSVPFWNSRRRLFSYLLVEQVATIATPLVQ